MTNQHSSAAAAFAAIETPATAAGIGPAQIEALKIWEARGSYGCEHHEYVLCMRRISAALFAPVAEQRDESECCQRLTPGCSVDHRGDRGDEPCQPW